MKKAITIEIPSHILESLQITPEQLKIELAIHLYEEYHLSVKQAAEVAGISEGVDIYTRQLTNKGEWERYDSFIDSLNDKATGSIRSQEWSAGVGDELRHLLTAYKQLVVTKQMVKRINSVSQAVEVICRTVRGNISSMAGFAEVILDDEIPLSLEEQKDFLRSIVFNEMYLRRGIQALEDIVKIETGNLRLQFGKVDLKKVVEEVIERTQKIAKGTNIELKGDLYNDLPEIRGDKHRISHALYSFILNTRFRDYTKIPRIDITLTHNQEWVTLMITDNGDGRPADYTETHARFGSISSLGASDFGRLERAVGEYLIEAHQGEIRVEYNQGSGTCVTIKLPIAQSEILM